MSNENVAALAALYQAEKADASGMFNSSMALMGVGAAYIVGAIGYLSKQETHTLSSTLVALAPAPLWLIAAFQSLITLASMMHTIFVEILEDALLADSGLNRDELSHVGSRGAAEIMDIRRSSWAHTITTIFVYGGIFAMVIGFTVYAVNRAWPYLTHGERIGAAGGYAIAIMMVLLCWILGLGKVGRADSQARSVISASLAGADDAPPGVTPEVAEGP